MIESIFDQAAGETACREQGEQAGGVSRMYAEPIEVWHQDGKPSRFVWRHQLFVVLCVLDHWVVSRDWWQQNDPDTDVRPEREFWRVEASPRDDVPPAVYELRRDVDTDDWLLVRVWDLARD